MMISTSYTARVQPLSAQFVMNSKSDYLGESSNHFKMLGSVIESIVQQLEDFKYYLTHILHML